jgi:hypothetical protein
VRCGAVSGFVVCINEKQDANLSKYKNTAVFFPEFHMVSGGGIAGVHPKAHRQKRQSPVRVQQCGAQERGSGVSYKLLKGQFYDFFYYIQKKSGVFQLL